MRKPVSPCTRECAARTTTCKFDGSCDKYQVYYEEVQKFKSLVKSNRQSEVNSYETNRSLDILEGKKRK